MKNLKTLFLLSFILGIFVIPLNAQIPLKNYSAEWKRVNDLIDKRLPKSALAEAQKIYALAKKENQEAQVIKALVTIHNLQTETREDNEILSIREFEKEISSSREPVSNILHSIIANYYYFYYTNHRYLIFNRTSTAPTFNKEDIATWSSNDFHKKISEHYLLSLSNEKQLQQVKLERFDAIITKGNVRHLRPTLFDLLVHQALRYFSNPERDLNRPAYAFEINDPLAFAPANDFVNHRFVTNDSLSLHHKALLLYQRLLSFHLKNTKPDALIDADILRLQFVYSRSVHPEKDKLYYSALENLATKYGMLPAASQAWYLMAAHLESKARTYQPHGDTTHRYARVKAAEILQRLISQKDSSEGKINALNLYNTISSPYVIFHVEKVNVPGQPFRALIDYRNFSTLHLRLIKADEKLKKQLEKLYDPAEWRAILSIKAEREWTQALPATNDMQNHKVEIKVDALPVGEYVLIAGSSAEFSKATTALGARLFYVSNISFVQNRDDYFVVDRESGQPLSNASVQVWVQKYDYAVSTYKFEKEKLYRTDRNGFFQLPKVNPDNSRGRHAWLFEISHGKDRLYMNDLLYDQYYYRENITGKGIINNIFLFTDRSLYRPGQTVFFKGIALTRNTNNRTAGIQQNLSTTIYLRDANYQDIDSIRVTSNEYGSFNGRFTLPASGLNGEFSIYTKKQDGHVAFSVEEYKRPKFLVEFEPIKGTYKINDNISVNGTAKAYAGNNIDGAIVRYRVIRTPRYPYPWMFWRGWFPPIQPMEIAHGEVKTDKDGKFIVNFTAIPDLTIDPKYDPAFDYRITADVTDINGETRSGEKTVSVSYKSLILTAAIPPTLETDSLKKLDIRTTNFNGEHEPSIVTLTMHELLPGQRLVRKRYWDRPDQFIMSKEEFIRHFPLDEYDNETDPQSWAKGQKVHEQTDSTKASGEWMLRNSTQKFKPGHYIIEITTKDRNGETVKDIKYIELTDEKDTRLSFPGYLWSQGGHAIEPGESTKVKLGTSAEKVFLIHQVLDVYDSTTYSFHQLNNEKKTFNFTAKESDRGGYLVSWVFVKHNRVYTYSQLIMVPWTNKDLKIEYATYRDKLLPGSEEKWKIKITGTKNEKLAAEMLASMYDASLDQFKPHGWTVPGLWPTFQQYSFWNTSQNFISVESLGRPIQGKHKELRKQYDALFQNDNEYGMRDLSYRRSGMEEMALEGKVPGVIVSQSVGNMKEKNGAMDSAAPPSAPQSEEPVTGPGAGVVQVRKNFNETAFFFPELRTDSSGAIEFSFTMPEALTRWKLMTIAHTRDAAFGYSVKEVITQKELMVQPNAPRFVREGDKIEFSAKLVNLTSTELTGQVELQLVDLATNQSVDGWFKNVMPNQYFTVAAGQSEPVKFSIEIPYLVDKSLGWKMIARSGNYSDGEENALPVLTNRMLVTETLPLQVRGGGTKKYSFDKLLDAGNSETIQHQSLTIEYTSNPVWYAVQALPYLMEYPYDCAEQVWNRYYANSLATFVANSSPRIKAIFETWKNTNAGALLSNLEKNQELKAVLLEETPWVLQAKSEAEQKKNIALLFDLMRMSAELTASYEKLKQSQSPNGGFVWFKGGPDDRYITQYIVTGIGHLKKLKAYADDGQQARLKAILNTAIPYLDLKLKEDYDQLVKNKGNLKLYSPSNFIIQYMYMRSFFPEYAIPANVKTAYTYFRERMQATWTKENKYMQGMAALALYRTGDNKTPFAILRSLKETSINNEELGMYWKEPVRSWWWYEAPIERQALLVEAFQEIEKDDRTADDLRTWLLKNKQTNNWNTTKATAEACYALLLQGTNWIADQPTVTITAGTASFSSAETTTEAGTGYFKKVVEGRNVKPDMGNITVSVTNAGNSSKPTWGGVYWQYFEDLDKITTAATPLKLDKKLFVEKNTDRGPVLNPVRNGDALKVGDKIKVRIELRVDRDMEYVHMKDMRASALEPVNVLSGYKYQGGLGYYESTKDASTNFFFSYLRKGTYVFEYALFVTHTGNFSNGITSIQCMYAPEFSSHSEGIRINVE